MNENVLLLKGMATSKEGGGELKMTTTYTTYPSINSKVYENFKALKKALEDKNINLQELNDLEKSIEILIRTKIVIKAEEV